MNVINEEVHNYLDLVKKVLNRKVVLLLDGLHSRILLNDIKLKHDFVVN